MILELATLALIVHFFTKDPNHLKDWEQQFIDDYKTIGNNIVRLKFDTRDVALLTKLCKKKVNKKELLANPPRKETHFLAFKKSKHPPFLAEMIRCKKNFAIIRAPGHNCAYVLKKGKRNKHVKATTFYMNAKFCYHKPQPLIIEERPSNEGDQSELRKSDEYPPDAPLLPAQNDYQERGYETGKYFPHSSYHAWYEDPEYRLEEREPYSAPVQERKSTLDNFQHMYHPYNRPHNHQPVAQNNVQYQHYDGRPPPFKDEYQSRSQPAAVTNIEQKPPYIVENHPPPTVDSHPAANYSNQYNENKLPLNPKLENREPQTFVNEYETGVYKDLRAGEYEETHVPYGVRYPTQYRESHSTAFKKDQPSTFYRPYNHEPLHQIEDEYELKEYMEPRSRKYGKMEIPNEVRHYPPAYAYEHYPTYNDQLPSFNAKYTSQLNVQPKLMGHIEMNTPHEAKSHPFVHQTDHQLPLYHLSDENKPPRQKSYIKPKLGEHKEMKPLYEKRNQQFPLHIQSDLQATDSYDKHEPSSQYLSYNKLPPEEIKYKSELYTEGRVEDYKESEFPYRGNGPSLYQTHNYHYYSLNEKNQLPLYYPPVLFESKREAVTVNSNQLPPFKETYLPRTVHKKPEQIACNICGNEENQPLPHQSNENQAHESSLEKNHFPAVIPEKTKSTTYNENLLPHTNDELNHPPLGDNHLDIEIEENPETIVCDVCGNEEYQPSTHHTPYENKLPFKNNILPQKNNPEETNPRVIKKGRKPISKNKLQSVDNKIAGHKLETNKEERKKQFKLKNTELVNNKNQLNLEALLKYLSGIENESGTESNSKLKKSKKYQYDEEKQSLKATKEDSLNKKKKSKTFIKYPIYGGKSNQEEDSTSEQETEIPVRLYYDDLEVDTELSSDTSNNILPPSYFLSHNSQQPPVKQKYPTYLEQQVNEYHEKDLSKFSQSFGDEFVDIVKDKIETEPASNRKQSTQYRKFHMETNTKKSPELKYYQTSYHKDQLSALKNVEEIEPDPYKQPPIPYRRSHAEKQLHQDKQIQVYVDPTSGKKHFKFLDNDEDHMLVSSSNDHSSNNTEINVDSNERKLRPYNSYSEYQQHDYREMESYAHDPTNQEEICFNEDKEIRHKVTKLSKHKLSDKVNHHQFMHNEKNEGQQSIYKKDSISIPETDDHSYYDEEIEAESPPSEKEKKFQANVLQSQQLLHEDNCPTKSEIVAVQPNENEEEELYVEQEDHSSGYYTENIYKNTTSVETLSGNREYTDHPSDEHNGTYQSNTRVYADYPSDEHNDNYDLTNEVDLPPKLVNNN